MSFNLEFGDRSEADCKTHRTDSLDSAEHVVIAVFLIAGTHNTLRSRHMFHSKFIPGALYDSNCFLSLWSFWLFIHVLFSLKCLQSTGNLVKRRSKGACVLILTRTAS